MIAAEARALIREARRRELDEGLTGELAVAFAKVLEAIAYDSDKSDPPAELARTALEA